MLVFYWGLLCKKVKGVLQVLLIILYVFTIMDDFKDGN